MKRHLDRFAKALGRVRQAPETFVLGIASAALGFYVIAVPFLLVRYPPLVDLPFHAAQTSILRHYFDPEFHFREQFSFHPIEVPYVSMYGIGALAAFALPIRYAVKFMAIVMLALPPIGLGVLSFGMRKSPWLGLGGLAFTWCTITQWGFLNFLGALGLFAMSLGFALLAVDRRTRTARVLLALSLVAIFFTHIYRLPFALLGVCLAGALVYPSTRCFKPLLWPMVPALVLFGIWLWVRPAELSPALHGFSLDLGRVSEIPRHLFGSYTPPEPIPQTPLGARERLLANVLLGLLAAATLIATLAFFSEKSAESPGTDRHWVAGVTILSLGIAAGLLVLYFVLPLKMGSWWYAYPREIVGAAYFLLAAIPALPKARPQRYAVLTLLGAAPIPMTQFVARDWRVFDRVTRDFSRIVEAIPRAPKLFYLVYDFRGSLRRASPFLHLPAWVQAEKGGWLGYHSVTANHSSIRYRDDSPLVPPALPDHFEWEPQHFRVQEHGPWFDAFLVRHASDPSALFRTDPEIHLTRREGTWWYYQRAD